jgi:hypothetical protein
MHTLYFAIWLLIPSLDINIANLEKVEAAPSAEDIGQ